MAVDPTSHTAYVTNADDGSVSVIDTTKRAVSETIKVGKSPDGIAVDPTTHAVYTANAGDDTVSVIQR